MSINNYFLQNFAFLSLKFILIVANSADPDKITLYNKAAFHLGLYCLTNYLFTSNKS